MRILYKIDLGHLSYSVSISKYSKSLPRIFLKYYVKYDADAVQIGNTPLL